MRHFSHHARQTDRDSAHGLATRSIGCPEVARHLLFGGGMTVPTLKPKVVNHGPNKWGCL